MLKKMILPAMAVACFAALAVPAASANVSFTNTEQEPVEEVSFTSKNLRLTVPNAVLACDHVQLWNSVIPSSGTFTGFGIAMGGLPFNECAVLNAEGEPITGVKVTVMGAHASFETENKGTLSIGLTYDVTVAPGVYVSGCTFHAENQPITFTTGEPGPPLESATISIPEAAMVGTGTNPPCPASGILHGSFTYDGFIDD
jgi:hypothetical protein